MTEIKIGDYILAKTTIKQHVLLLEDANKPKLNRGRIVYIHPKGRYITAAFDLSGNEIRESFKPGEFIKTEGQD